jgi:hypothetical protein
LRGLGGLRGLRGRLLRARLGLLGLGARRRTLLLRGLLLRGLLLGRRRLQLDLGTRAEERGQCDAQGEAGAADCVHHGPVPDWIGQKREPKLKRKISSRS